MIAIKPAIASVMLEKAEGLYLGGTFSSTEMVYARGPILPPRPPTGDTGEPV